ncbi:hypothetical protein FOA52_016012 [Chlamydomonas sp. UWO 241]|nr:hypothetical protein FOA52_016012 [Chlamydomonas sp. UWO 241]
MPPRTLRGPTRRAAVALPQHARFSFLSDASGCLAGVAPELARHLGAVALKVANNPEAAVARRSAMQLCAQCGVRLVAASLSSVELVELSKRTQRRCSAALSTQPSGQRQLNVVSVVRSQLQRDQAMLLQQARARAVAASENHPLIREPQLPLPLLPLPPLPLPPLSLLPNAQHQAWSS